MAQAAPAWQSAAAFGARPAPGLFGRLLDTACALFLLQHNHKTVHLDVKGSNGAQCDLTVG